MWKTFIPRVSQVVGTRCEGPLCRLDGGEFNDILIINEELIFRFPKSSDGLERLRVEVAILDAIQENISLPIPDPTYVSDDTETVGVAFMGYRMLPGKPLRDCLEVLRVTGSYQQRVAAQLAAFLRELHGFSAKTIDLEVPVHDRGRRGALPRIHQSIRENLYPRMRPDARDLVTNQFDTFLNDPASFDYEQTLKHGDLGPGNILLEAQTHTISGIIDFGSAGLDDPAVDLGHISFWGESLLGSRFVGQLYDYYPMTESLSHRVQFFRVMTALMVALQGLQGDDKEAFELGLGQFV